MFSFLPVAAFQGADSAETWMGYEHALLSCLRTRDDPGARRCLEKLSDRFGESNAQVMGLKGLYEEAVAEDEAALDRILRGYESTLNNDPTNTPIAKRRIALLRSLSRPDDAIEALVNLLDGSPVDAEGWSELSDLYLRQGLYRPAIFCLEEVLLITPNAWNMLARMGEMVYLFAKESSTNDDRWRGLIESTRWFCRSIELCDDYLRGFYGLKLVTNELLSVDARTMESALTADVPPLSTTDLRRLHELATNKLAELVQRSSSIKGPKVHPEAEIIAARELLDRHRSDAPS